MIRPLTAVLHRRGLLVTTPLDFYAAPGTARPGFWRMFVGIALIVVGWMLWTVVVMVSFVLYKLTGGLDVNQSMTALTGRYFQSFRRV